MQAVRALVLPLLLALSACSMMGGETTTAAPAAAPAPALARASAPAAATVAEPVAQIASAAAPTATGGQPARWGALFVAGDNSITAFDNATRRFYNIVQGKPRMKLARLTSDPSIAPTPGDIASLGTLDESLGYINSTSAENCLVFMTSHGNTAGFELSAHDNSGGTLPPRTLDWLLDRHCGVKPTVVIVSACYSGLFLEEGMEQPNRIILTAARRDRPSFGCGVEENYTYYDKCLLDSWLWAYTWQELHDKTKACIAEKEAALGATPSEPQAYFGDAVSALPMP
jgi:hypothetical protein